MISVKGFTTISIKDIMNPVTSPAIKKFFVANESGDITDIYYAQATASGGEKCLRQRLAYATVSGIDVIQKEAWENATWSGSTWDIL